MKAGTGRQGGLHGAARCTVDDGGGVAPVDGTERVVDELRGLADADRPALGHLGDLVTESREDGDGSLFACHELPGELQSVGHSCRSLPSSIGSAQP